jgi:hypothetical protein
MPRWRGYCCLVLCALCAALASGAYASRATTIATLYRPLSSTAVVVISGPTRSGSCWEGAITTPRRDAWRCISGNYIYDPCFSSLRTPRIALCVTEPWRDRGVRLQLTRSLPSSLANRGPLSIRSRPWALELQDGTRCIFDSGASRVLQRLRANYFCRRGGAELFGLPDRRSEPWTIASAGARATHLGPRLAIVRAWM